MRAASGLKKAFMAAADYLEAYNYFDVVAGKIGTDTFRKAGIGSADDYADAFVSEMKRKMKQMSGLELDLEDRLIKTTNAKNLGLNLTEITQYQASIASITNAMGQAQEVSTATAKAFSMLAADMGSLRNVDYEQVSANLQSALTGQARALYKYGIDLTAATLEQYAYANGVEKSVSEMTQAEKAQLRLLAILDQSKVAWGDLANTINSPANQLRMLKNNFKEVGTVLGQLFIPIMQKTLPWINGLTIAIKRLLVDIAALLGIELNLDEFGQGFSDTIDEDTEALDDLNKSMKETKKGIREFDELKVIGGDNSKAGSGLADQIDLTQQILDATAEYERVWDEAYDRMQSKAEAIADALSGALDPIRKIVEDFTIGDFFKAGEDTSQLVISIFDFFTNAINSVDWNALGVKIGKFIEGIDWEGILKSIARLVWSAIQGAFNLWTGAFSVAPFETAIITAFALLKFTGLGSILSTTITKSITTWFKEKGIDKNMLAKAGLGVISLGLGISLTIDNIKDIKAGKYAKNSLQSVLKTVISSMLIGAGAAFLGLSFGASFGTSALIFGIGFGLSLIFNALSAELTDPEADVISQVDEEKQEWAKKAHLDTIDVLTNITLKDEDIEIQSKNIDFYAGKVKDLSERYDELTNKERGELKFYSDELIKLVPEVANSIDSITGAYIGEADAIDKLIEKQKQQIKLSAYTEALTDLEKQKAVIEANIKKAKNGGAEEVARRAVKSDTYYAKTIYGFTDEDIEKYLKMSETEWDKYLKEHNSAAMQQMGKLRRSTESYYERYGQYIEPLEADLKNVNDTIEYYTKKYAEAYEDVYESAANEAKNGDKKLSKQIEDSKLPAATKKTMQAVTDAIESGEKVARTDMNTLFLAIDGSFAGLGDGNVPAEVQSAMDKVKDAIENNKPELVQYMADLKIAMEEAFANAHYDTNGEMIWDLNGAGTAMNEALNRLEEGASKIRAGARLTSNDSNAVRKAIAAVFVSGIPESIEEELSHLDEVVIGNNSSGIAKSVSRLRELIYEEGKQLGMNLPAGMGIGIFSGTGRDVVPAATYMAKTGQETVKKVDDQNSPSKVYRRFGLFDAEGMALGFLDGIPTLKSAMGAIASTMQSIVSGMTLNVPSLNLGGLKGFNARGNYQNGSTSLYEQMASRYLNGDNGQTEVVFRVEGDPYGLFKVVREQNNSYYKRTGRSAF